MPYLYVSYDDITSPVEEGLYILNDEDQYELSDDEEPDIDVDYYYYYDDENEPEDIQLFEYVDPEEIVSPADELLYEWDDETEMYFLSEDQEPDPEKDYYMMISETIDWESTYEQENYYHPFLIAGEDESSYIEDPSEEGLYELIDGVYVPTEDTLVDSTKQYYIYEPPVYEDIDETDYEEDDGSGSIDLTPYPPSIVAEDDFSDDNLEYIQADVTFVKNPRLLGLYEKTDGQFVLTADTETTLSKIYYEKIQISDYRPFQIPEDRSPNSYVCYEFVNDEYVLTKDVVAVEGKTYYLYDPLDSFYEEYDSVYNPAYVIGSDEGVPEDDAGNELEDVVDESED